MALADIKVMHIRKAIAEFDRLGEATFLANYGFDQSRKFLLIHRGAVYPSKAIVGAAHHFAGGPARALSGGAPTLAVLRRLGFETRELAFDDWRLWSKLEHQVIDLASAALPWTPWSSLGFSRRHGPKTASTQPANQALSEALSFPGVYVIGVFGKRPSRVIPLPEGLKYVGLTTRPLRERLKEFNNAAKGRWGHSGGTTFRRLRFDLSRAYVALFPVRLPSAEQDMAIGLLERYLMWSYARRRRQPPACNRK